MLPAPILPIVCVPILFNQFHRLLHSLALAFALTFTIIVETFEANPTDCFKEHEANYVLVSNFAAFLRPNCNELPVYVLDLQMNPIYQLAPLGERP